MQEMPETWVQSLGRDDPLEEGTGGPLQYSRLENPMDRGTWGLQSMGLPRVGHRDCVVSQGRITAPSTVCFRSLCICFCLTLTLSSSLCLGCSALLSSPRYSPWPARDPCSSSGFCPDLPDPGEGLRDGARLSLSRRAVTACRVDVALFQKARAVIRLRGWGWC